VEGHNHKECTAKEIVCCNCIEPHAASSKKIVQKEIKDSEKHRIQFPNYTWPLHQQTFQYNPITKKITTTVVNSTNMNIQDKIDKLESKINSITTNLLSFILDTCFELNDSSTEEKKRIKCAIDSNFHHSIGNHFN
jgi:hypothetical protein